MPWVKCQCQLQEEDGVLEWREEQAGRRKSHQPMVCGEKRPEAFPAFYDYSEHFFISTLLSPLGGREAPVILCLFNLAGVIIINK